MNTRWQQVGAPGGDDYDERWRRLAATGHNVHGEADLVEHLMRGIGGMRVLDAGCGTGRVAIELARRGFSVVGVDADGEMLDAASAKAPDLAWRHRNLADLSMNVDGTFDLAVLAGNVMIFVAPGSEDLVLQAITACLVPGGLLVAGFALRPHRLQLVEYDRLAQAAGLVPVARWATWDREPFAGGDYAVSVHRRPAI